MKFWISSTLELWQAMFCAKNKLSYSSYAKHLIIISTSFLSLTRGEHKLEVRVLERSSPRRVVDESAPRVDATAAQISAIERINIRRPLRARSIVVASRERASGRISLALAGKRRGGSMETKRHRASPRASDRQSLRVDVMNEVVDRR